MIEPLLTSRTVAGFNRCLRRSSEGALPVVWKIEPDDGDEEKAAGPSRRTGRW
jgi:hypothetical protein